MHISYNFLLFALTVLGGSSSLLFTPTRKIGDNLVLAFSGSFLLGITLLHLLPETFEEMGRAAGRFLLIGFFLQLLIQRLTHGMEHGHIHQVHTGNPKEKGHERHAHFPVLTIVIGLTAHAFMEGIPLGYNYRGSATSSSLYFAVAAHKLPEAMLVTTLIAQQKGTKSAWIFLTLFAAVTPMASIACVYLGQTYFFASRIIECVIPIVAGAFIHISTTIFFESGTRHHTLSRPRLTAILVGLLLSAATLLLEK